MKEAKKMIVGRTWKAKKKPRLPSAPGPAPSGPKTNCAPSAAKLKRMTNPLLIQLKTFRPTSVFRTRNAKRNCRTIPVSTSRQLIFAWSGEEKRHSRDNRKARKAADNGKAIHNY